MKFVAFKMCIAAQYKRKLEVMKVMMLSHFYIFEKLILNEKSFKNKLIKI